MRLCSRTANRRASLQNSSSYGRSIYPRSFADQTYSSSSNTKVNLCDHTFTPNTSDIAAFEFFGPRIVYLLKSMDDWRPRSYEPCATYVSIAGYADRRDWWVAMFALFFGFITVVGLGLTAYQAYLAHAKSRSELLGCGRID